ncbi:MAG: type II toxin-antitoxin system VapC family toxin [Candidatus Tectomicrobia bacterium]|nr:type II toxin-antitoxin system VapC family toxin [Candidatus Tectomicrobia bacterium]
MKLEDVPDGGHVFVDSNILIYHFSGISPECRSFLERCESKQIQAFTGVHILLEVTHRLMILEALSKGLISSAQPARKLKEKPEIIRSLSDYNRSVQQIPRMGIQIRSITPAIARASKAIRDQEGLMTNDSVTVALMQKMGLADIATHDSDLMRIFGLTVYQPGDVP